MWPHAKHPKGLVRAAREYQIAGAAGGMTMYVVEAKIVALTTSTNFP
jgi:hypothetical protein